MQLAEFRQLFTNTLANVYPKTEIDSFFFILIEEVLQLQRIATVMQPDYMIAPEPLATLQNAMERLQNEEPIQYILGKTEFYGLPFNVTPDTLIPRPETEELVRWILESLSVEGEKCQEESNKLKGEALSILDIGTGTGCIPITLAKHLPKAHVTAIDISSEAIAVAAQNAAINQVSVDLIQTDILATDNLGSVIKTSAKKLDVIVSNPPYVRDLEKIEIKNNVLQNEPHLALFVTDDDPLIFYRKIALLAREHLADNGQLFFEINQYLGKETVALLQKIGFSNIELRKDIFGNDRMIRASL